MRTFGILFCTLAVLVALQPCAFAAAADDDEYEILVFDCDPGNEAYVKTAIFYDIEPEENDWTYYVRELANDEKTQTCKLPGGATLTVEVKTGLASAHNDKISLKLNGHPIDDLSFSEPDESISYYFSANDSGELKIEHEVAVTDIEKHETVDVEDILKKDK